MRIAAGATVLKKFANVHETILKLYFFSRKGRIIDFHINYLPVLHGDDLIHHLISPLRLKFIRAKIRGIQVLLFMRVLCYNPGICARG